MPDIFNRDNLRLERAMTQDIIYVRWRDIRAITGAVIQTTPESAPEVVPGACTLYMEGELGFIVNHTAEEVIGMIEERQVVQ